MKNQSEVLAENLTYYRKAAGYTQLEIAEKFNYSDKSISKWERGEGAPDVFILKALADLYGLTVDDFFNPEKKRAQTSTRRRHWYITGLSVALVWLIAATGFTVCMIAIPDTFPWWLFYIYAVLGSGIIGTIFSSIWKKLEFQLISISIIIWSVCLSAFLTLQLVNPMAYAWLLFIVGIPVEALAIIWYFLKRNNRKKKVVSE
jgi:transcriptional regulator with XRE-family HTH domain